MTKHTGGCHCGRVRYEVEADIDEVLSCNCSMCQKRGSLLTFVPDQQFTLLSGDDDLTDYQFNKKIIHHLFCVTCGVASFARGVAPDGSKMVAINVRCLEGVDPASLTVKAIDGRSF
jgi:hypothetical protein